MMELAGHLLQYHGTGSFSALLHRGGRYFLRCCSIWSTAHPTGSSPYMASGFSHRSPLWPDGFRQLGSLFQAMTSKPPIWQALSQGAWLFVYRHPDPTRDLVFPVRITGCSNRNQSLLWSSIFVTFRSKNSLCMSCFKWRLPTIIRMGTDMIIPYAHISPDCFIQTFRTGKTVRID